jgi:hypothetical protein
LANHGININDVNDVLESHQTHTNKHSADVTCRPVHSIQTQTSTTNESLTSSISKSEVTAKDVGNPQLETNGNSLEVQSVLQLKRLLDSLADNH